MVTQPIPLCRPLPNTHTPALALAESGRFTFHGDEPWRRASAPVGLDSGHGIPPTRYRVGPRIGCGGMGVIYEGRYLPTGQTVALKVLRPDLAHIPEAVVRFRREAEILTRVAGEGVVKVYDFDVGNNGLPYIAMERLSGCDLRSWLDTNAPAGVARAAALGTIFALAQALRLAHVRNIVHRDIKPENVFVANEPRGRSRIVLLDFGVAREATTQQRITQPAHGVGTVVYMSPEQLGDSRDAIPASDVWSLGILLVELLTGKSPYPQQCTDTQLICRIMTEGAPPLAELLPGSDAALCELVDRCLAMDVADRYSGASALAKAVAQCVEEAK